VRNFFDKIYVILSVVVKFGDFLNLFDIYGINFLLNVFYLMQMIEIALQLLSYIINIPR